MGCLRHIEPHYKFPLNAKWHVVTERELLDYAQTDPQRYADYDAVISEYQKNRLSFFLPHGRPRDDKHGNDGVAVLNDWEHDLPVVICGNQFGKTALGAAFIGLRIVPTEPDWPVFAEHGVEWREWDGPKEVIVASFAWDNVGTAWEEYVKFLPRDQLQGYAEGWGEWYDPETDEGSAFKDEKGKARPEPAFGDGKPKKLRLKCGSRITFLCYTQKQIHWEGKKCDIAHLDEQCPENKFDSLTVRQATRGPFTPIIMTLTAVVMDDRPDTGASGWIIRKLVRGGMTKGRTVKQYGIAVDDVPDAMMDPKTKHDLYVQYIEEPEQQNDDKKIREGRARYLGEPEEGGGIIISAWNPEIHLIEPFDIWKYKPSIFRMIDPGEKPCAALLIALMPWGDAVCFKEYYEYGRSIAQNAKGIVEELCGNSLRQVDTGGFEDLTWPVYEELNTRMEFAASEMDARSFGTKLKESGRLTGLAYQDSGLECSPADARHDTTRADGGKGLIAVMIEWFELVKGRPHINQRLGRDYPADLASRGSPRVAIFNDMGHIRGEIEGWMCNPKTGKPFDRDDHLIDCFKYFCARDRQYEGDFRGHGRVEEEPSFRKQKRTEYTAY